LGPGCVVNTNKIYEIRISQGVIGGETGTGPITGSISPSGEMKLSHAGVDRNHRPMGTVYYSGSLQENSGSGTFNKPGTSCQGTFTAKRMSHDGRPNSATALKR
jgi:hypothetical protein